jgi:hypothetical protein
VSKRPEFGLKMFQTNKDITDGRVQRVVTRKVTRRAGRNDLGKSNEVCTKLGLHTVSFQVNRKVVGTYSGFRMTPEFQRGEFP